MHHTPLLTTLAVGFVLAFVLGALANRLRISPLVGYLLAGVLAGPFTPGYVADQALSVEIAELGVILLMFGVGLHFSLKDLLSVKAIAIPGAVVQIGVATLLGLGLAWMMGWNFGGGLVFGLALSVASTVVLLRALEQRQLIDTKRGRIAIGWLIVEDLAMVLTLVLLPALAGSLGGTSDGGDGGLLMPILLTLGKVAAFVAVMIVGGRRFVPWVLERVAKTGSRELFTLAVLAIALGIAYGSAVIFGVSFALGAFFAGMILNESELSHEAAENSLPLRDAFAVLFFVSVGMLFNPAILIQEPLPVLATFLVIVFGKSVAAYVIVRMFGHPNSTALTIAASLAQIGEFSFILVGLGVTLNLLPEAGRDLVLAGAILSILVNPLLFIAIDRLQARQEQKGRERARRGPGGAPGPAAAGAGAQPRDPHRPRPRWRAGERAAAQGQGAGGGHRGQAREGRRTARARPLRGGGQCRQSRCADPGQHHFGALAADRHSQRFRGRDHRQPRAGNQPEPGHHRPRPLRRRSGLPGAERRQPGDHGRARNRPRHGRAGRTRGRRRGTGRRPPAAVGLTPCCAGSTTGPCAWRAIRGRSWRWAE